MRKALLSLALCALPLVIHAQQWPEVHQEAKPGLRWWWLGSAVDKPNLQWTLQQYANQGVGAVEITPIYGVQGNQANNIDYLSDHWMEMLRFTEQQGRATGIEVDMATGTGWPFGGPWVPLQESASQMVIVDKRVDERKLKALDLTPPSKKASNCQLVGIYAFRMASPSISSRLLAKRNSKSTSNNKETPSRRSPSMVNCPAKGHGASWRFIRNSG